MCCNGIRRIRLTIYTKAEDEVEPIILDTLPTSLIEILSIRVIEKARSTKEK